MKNPKMPTRPTSLGENENIIVTIKRKESRPTIINALSISVIIAQVSTIRHPALWSKTSYRPVAIWKTNKIISFPHKMYIPKS